MNPNDSKPFYIKHKSILIVVSCSLVLGVVSSVLTDRYFIRDITFPLEHCEVLRRKNNAVNCQNVVVSTRGWPFPTVSVANNGTEERFHAEEVTCYKCPETDFGDQRAYNALLFSTGYLLATFIILKLLASRAKSKTEF